MRSSAEQPRDLLGTQRQDPALGLDERITGSRRQADRASNRRSDAEHVDQLGVESQRLPPSGTVAR